MFGKMMNSTTRKTRIFIKQIFPGIVGPPKYRGGFFYWNFQRKQDYIQI